MRIKYIKECIPYNLKNSLRFLACGKPAFSAFCSLTTARIQGSAQTINKPPPPIPPTPPLPLQSLYTGRSTDSAQQHLPSSALSTILSFSCISSRPLPFVRSQITIASLLLSGSIISRSPPIYPPTAWPARDHL